MPSMTTKTSEPRRFLTDSGTPQAFVIVSSARSGSNLLVSYFRQVRSAACFGEIMRSDFPNKPGWDKLVKRLDMPAGSAALHAQDLTVWWETVLAQGLRERRWLGAKAFYYHRPDDTIWERFDAPDHRIVHLWRDATFDQYVSRAPAVSSGQWKAANGVAGETATPLVDFDPADYLRYREQLLADITATRTRYGGSERYLEIEYRQLSDGAHMIGLMETLFGERVELQEARQRQRGRAKLEYLSNPDDAVAYVGDSIDGGFASQ
jgi:LPS sulfotransferase NodH